MSKRTNSRIWKIATLLTALLLLSSACGGSNADSESITVYSGRGKNLIQPLLDDFTEQTGIAVEVRYASSSDLALLLETEAGKTPADIFISSSPGSVGFLAERDLLATLPQDIAPAAVTGPANNWIALTGRQRVLVYNTDNIDPASLPSSIFDLGEDEWNGKVAIAPGNGSFQDFFTLMRLQHGDETATSWLDDLADGGAPQYPNNNSIVQAVARGEVDMGLVNHYYLYRLLAENPDLTAANYEFAEGDIGSVLITTTISMTTTGDRDVAQKLIAFMLTESAQKYFSEETFEYPLGADVDANEQLPDLGPIDVGTFEVLGGELTKTLELIREAGLDA